jgi:predicted TIM-barrel fold metal-dependent hydrolase
MLIIDAQIHTWQPSTPRRPWIDTPPAGEETTGFEPDQILAEMDRAGVDRAVLIPHGGRSGLDPAGFNTLALRAAAEHPDRFAVMGIVPALESPPGAPLATWLGQPSMLGVRISHRQARTGVLADGTADWFFSAASSYGIPVMIYAPGQTAVVADIARRYPGAPVILDHLNIDAGRRGSDLTPEIDALLPLADSPNVAVKLSALPRLVTDPFPFASLHPHIKRVVQAFGAERCIWGSDLSGLPCPYGDWVRAITDHAGFLSLRERELIMGRSLAAWLRWPVPAEPPSTS